jgi:hypothetical protein
MRRVPFGCQRADADLTATSIVSWGVKKKYRSFVIAAHEPGRRSLNLRPGDGTSISGSPFQDSFRIADHLDRMPSELCRWSMAGATFPMDGQISQQGFGSDVKFIILDDDQLTYHSPLPPGDVTALQDLLRESNSFVPSFVGADVYSVETYIVQYARERTETTLLFDRNLYSQVVALTKGSRATEKSRFAAAVMAFASCANAQIEPSLALYEGSASGARRAWKRDLEVFHRADEIHPANWAALALGYAERFDRRIPGKRLRSEPAKSFDPTAKLRFYGFVYPIVLKMATISRVGGQPDEKMIELLDWMYYRWHFSAPATFLAIQALSHDPPKDVFKNIGSKDRKKALAGVRNAAWDLVYITAWYEELRPRYKNMN